MSKRRIFLLVATTLAGMSTNLMAAESPFPPATEDSLYDGTPAQQEYFKQREAANPNPVGASGPIFPRGGQIGGGRTADLRYLKERAARVAAEAAVDHTVTTSGMSYITVPHEATVRIMNDKGQSFVWTADTFGEADLALRSIAPQNFAAGQTRVFVRHPYEHTIKD